MNLCKNKIVDLKVLEENVFVNLKYINLSYNNIEDIRIFNKAKFVKIETILLSYNNIKNIGVFNRNHLRNLINFKIDNQCNSNLNNNFH